MENQNNSANQNNLNNENEVNAPNQNDYVGTEKKNPHNQESSKFDLNNSKFEESNPDEKKKKELYEEENKDREKNPSDDVEDLDIDESTGGSGFSEQ